jgi:alkylation response protein AidB-like acyl-CoA dehydrogenase
VAKLSLILTQEQSLLQESAASFARDMRDLRGLRRRRDGVQDSVGDPSLWQQIVDLGWPAIPFDESFGGLGLGYAELGIVMEEMGRHLLHTPMLSSVVMFGGIVSKAGTQRQKEMILPGVCDGSRLGTFAYQESARHNPYAVSTRLVQDGDGYRLSGQKRLVLDGGAASDYVVLARESGESADRDGLVLVMIPADDERVVVRNQQLLDGRSVANISFHNVAVSEDQLLGNRDDVPDIVDDIFAKTAVILSAEMTGGIQSTFEMTLKYLKTREQFGSKIGSFQGLKHRAARWFCELELSKAIVLEALRAIDSDSEEMIKLASVCKARVSDTYHLSGKEGIQMHGGIGVTDEHDVGLYMKHGWVTEILFGDSLYHRLKFAGAQGY